MIGLLTFTTYGTWLPGRARGWVDPQSLQDRGEIVEPDALATMSRRRSLLRRVVTLAAEQRALILSDLARIARLRRFRPDVATVAPDHVHVLLEPEDGTPVPRLVQLVKGSLSRTLTLAEGDPPARSADGRALMHHKWWSAQYSFRRVAEGAHVVVRDRLVRHDGIVAVRSRW